MPWPPPLPPNTRSNEDPQINDHPSDHNTLVDAFTDTIAQVDLVDGKAISNAAALAAQQAVFDPTRPAILSDTEIQRRNADDTFRGYLDGVQTGVGFSQSLSLSTTVGEWKTMINGQIIDTSGLINGGWCIASCSCTFEFKPNEGAFVTTMYGIDIDQNADAVPMSGGRSRATNLLDPGTVQMGITSPLNYIFVPPGSSKITVYAGANGIGSNAQLVEASLGAVFLAR